MKKNISAIPFVFIFLLILLNVAGCVSSPLPNNQVNPTLTTTSTPTISILPTQSNYNPTVYITETGSKYHVLGCQYLWHSCIAISLSEAKAEGYTPCSVCNPPR